MPLWEMGLALVAMLFVANKKPVWGLVLGLGGLVGYIAPAIFDIQLQGDNTEL